jgi:hypothetical protein
MKRLLYYSLFLFIGWKTCSIKKPIASAELKTEKKPAALMSDSINFTAQVQPILEKRCSPCHFTGGKMYERLPFDKDTTIINHETGILKRIKDSEENQVIKSFILQNKSSSALNVTH